MFNQFIVTKTKLLAENQKAYFYFFDACLRGISQVVFLNNPITGLLILLGIYIQSPWIAASGILGLCSSTITAILLKFNRDQWKSGLYGFNGLLIGLACATFQQMKGPSILWTISFSIILGSVSTFFQILLNQIFVKKLKSSSLTFSFNLVLFLFLIVGLKHTNTGLILTKTTSTVTSLTALNLLEALLRGISQIFLSDNIISAGFILVGIFVGSRVVALWAILGSAIGTLMAFTLGAPEESIISGLWQYNASLGCLAIGGVFFSWSKRIFILAILCGVLSTLLTGALSVLFSENLPFATLPFCLATTAFIITIKKLPNSNQ